MAEVEVEVKFDERITVPEEMRPELDRDKDILRARAIFRSSTLERLSVKEGIVKFEREVSVFGNSQEGFYYRVEEYTVDEKGRRQEISRNGYTSNALRNLTPSS